MAETPYVRDEFVGDNPRETLVQRIRDTNDGWPESAMNVGNLSAHQTANEDLIAIAYGAS